MTNNNYKAFYEFAKGIVCPETSSESRWIKDAGNDPADKLNKLESAINLMEIIIGEEDPNENS